MPFMSRKARPPAADVQPNIERISSFVKSHNINLNQLAANAKVSQSALCRFMLGERKTLTTTAKQVLSYIDNRHKWHDGGAAARMEASPQPSSLAPIEDVIRANWQLSAGSARLLVAMVAAVAPVLKSASIEPTSRG